MDASLKAKWVEALRSGKYKQERLTLQSGGGFCCLGVLCALNDLPMGNCFERDNAYNWVKPMVRDHFGRLTEMNDHGRKSFAQIADYIEANL